MKKDQFTDDGSMFLGIVGPVVLFAVCVVGLLLALF